jgi:hypothetical protein
MAASIARDVDGVCMIVLPFGHAGPDRESLSTQKGVALSDG